jgi:hypothetical protein
MALNSQGCLIQRQATAAGATVYKSTVYIFDATAIHCTAAANDFAADGFTTGMRISFDGTVNYTGGYTIHSVAATVLGILENMATSTSITVGIHGAKFTNIGSITNFSAPSGSSPIIDVTHLGSTAKEKLVGISDEGQMTFEFLYDPTDDMHVNHLSSDRRARTQRTFNIQFSDQPSATGTGTMIPSQAMFNGYVTGYSRTAGVDQAIKGNVTIEIDGPVRWSTRAT